MSTRREDDSRPASREISQRTTARDVPIAKFKEVSVGTSPPRALRGPSLLPGQGAPEQIVPEDVGLAVLRDADTLDGPRVAARRAPELTSSPPPTSVSVEVARVRTAPPIDPSATTPTSPSARSIQSGTLMSVGSVDPRAPTELSLPSPRSLSLSERSAYFGPEAVVDRTPSPGPLSGPPDRLPSSELREYAEVVERTPDSPAPPAQHFARAPHSYSPVSPAATYGLRSPAPSPPPPSVPAVAPQFQIHSELEAIAHAFVDDAFDLRSVSTQREPLAGRKPQPSADWSRVPELASPALHVVSAPNWRSSSPSLSPGERVSGAPPRQSNADFLPASAPRTSVPLSWVLGAAVFALLLAFVVGYFVRAPAVPDLPDARPSSATGLPAPALGLTRDARLPDSTAPSSSGGADRASGLLPAGVVTGGAVPSSATKAPLKPVASATARPADSLGTGSSLPRQGATGTVQAAPPADSSPKARQSIY